MVVESHTHYLAAHVVEQVVAIGMYGLSAQPGQFGAVEQRGSSRPCVQCGHVAQVALGLIEHLFAMLHLRVVDVASCGDSQSVQV